ncbi:MAG: NFACT RNA binding domain-containing protein [Candidatus Pacearchaeota archaeon]
MTLNTFNKKKNTEKWYHKYRWFFTSNNNLVVGGKNAEQNEELVKKFMSNEKYVVMHTKSQGSPFSIIISEKYNEKDLEECAIFTGCFSRAWREGKKSVDIDTFLMEQVIKNKNMKTGTFGVVGEIDRKKVELKFYITNQEGKIRAVPFKKNKERSICIIPGKINKEKFAEQISIKLEIPLDEILNALPTGGFKILNQK